MLQSTRSLVPSWHPAVIVSIEEEETMAVNLDKVDERTRKVIEQLDYIANWMHASGLLPTSAFVEVEASGSITTATMTFGAPEIPVEGELT